MKTVIIEVTATEEYDDENEILQDFVDSPEDFEVEILDTEEIKEEEG